MCLDCLHSALPRGDSKNDKALGRQQFFHGYLPQPSNRDGDRGGRGLTVVLGGTRGCVDHSILKLWTPGYLEPTFLLSSASLPNLIIMGIFGRAWACVKSADDCGSWFSPSTMRAPRMELGSSGLAANILPTEPSCWTRKFHPNIILQNTCRPGDKTCVRRSQFTLQALGFVSFCMDGALKR